MARPKRRNQRTADDPAALAALLPDDLRSFKPSTDTRYFHAHLTAVAQFVRSDDLATPVINAAGLAVADWYRMAFSARPV